MAMKQSTLERMADEPGGLKSHLEGRNEEIIRLKAEIERLTDENRKMNSTIADDAIEIERLLAALINLYDYCEDHNWGTIPIGKTIEAAEDLVRELRADEQNGVST